MGSVHGPLRLASYTCNQPQRSWRVFWPSEYTWTIADQTMGHCVFFLALIEKAAFPRSRSQNGRTKSQSLAPYPEVVCCSCARYYFTLLLPALFQNRAE
jgi:hypothetical protein